MVSIVMVRSSCVVHRHSYTTTDGVRLGSWLYSQRKLYNEGKISPERFAMLESICGGDEWRRPPRDRRWLEAFEALKVYHEVFDNTDVPRDFKTKSGIRLGLWTRTQRKRYEMGKMPEDRKRLLDELAFAWSSPSKVKSQQRTRARQMAANARVMRDGRGL